MHKKKWDLCVTNSDEENTMKKMQKLEKHRTKLSFETDREHTKPAFWGENPGNFSSFETSEETEESDEGV